MRARIILLILLAISLLTSQASAGCGRWVVRQDADYDYLADPLFDSDLEESSENQETGAKEDAKPGQKSDRSVPEKDNSAQWDTSAQGQTDPSPDLSGKWDIRLNDSFYLETILIQSGAKLQGYGSLIDRGRSLHSPFTATGLLSDKGLSLEAKLTHVERAGPDRRYRLVLSLENSTYSGDYEEYLGGSLAARGTASAKRPGS